MGAGELVGELTELVERAVVVVEHPGSSASSADQVLVALGQVTEHVTRPQTAGAVALRL